MKTIKIIDEDTLEIKEVLVDDKTAEKAVVDSFNAKLRDILSCDPEEFYQVYENYKKAESEFNSIYNPFKMELLELYKQHSNLPKNIIIGGVKVTYVEPSKRTYVDSKKLKEEEPELASKYSKEVKVSSSLRLEKM